MRHPDGRTVTVPTHSGRDIGRGLLRKILRDAEVTRDAFVELIE
jgi:predicted RNA binding protein YcfA (HicA-like mRNA interferase family)